MASNNEWRVMSAVVVRTVILSVCFPVLVWLAFIMYFTTGWTTFVPEDLKFGAVFLWTLLIVVWLASIPLALAVILLHRMSRLIAYLCASVLIPLSIFGFIVAGLLQSETVVLTVAALSLPAWLALPLVKLLQSRS